jgi:Tfp pilus assembly protein PilO
MLSIKRIQAFLSNMTKKDKVILYAAIIMVLLAIMDRAFINPVLLKINGLNEQIIEMESAVRKSAHIMSQKDRILQESAKYKSFLDNIGTDDEEGTSLLKEIGDIANKSEVYLEDMRPSGIKDMETYRKFMVTLSCEGQMEQIADFILNVESSKNLLTIERYQISPKAKGSSIAKCNISISKTVVK